MPVANSDSDLEGVSSAVDVIAKIADVTAAMTVANDKVGDKLLNCPILKPWSWTVP